MAKFNKEKNCIELEDTDVIGPDNMMFIYTGIRCKDCAYFHNDWICDRPHEGPVCRDPEDFCSGATRRVSNDSN